MKVRCEGTHLKDSGNEDGVCIGEAEKCSDGVGCRLQVSDSADHCWVLSACFSALNLF